MTEITRALNELKTAMEELALVAPYAEQYPDHYQMVVDAYVEANQRYLEVLGQQTAADPPKPWCDIDDPPDDEDYDEDDDPRPTPPTPTPQAPDENHVSGDGDVIDIGDDQGEEQSEDEAYGPDNPYRIEDLTRDPVPDWLDVTEEKYYEFKRRVYTRCVSRAAAVRSFVWGISDDQRRMLRRRPFRAEIIADAQNLLSAAEADLDAARAAGDEAALRTTATSIALASAYRDADYQFGLWNSQFTATYVTRHQRQLERLEGEPLSDAWVNALASRIGAATATPGYSLHQRGIALDFRNPEPGIANEKTDEAMARWRDTWFYRWLVEHAGEYGFEAYAGEAWHWNYTALMHEEN